LFTRFTWDARKAAVNFGKHGVSFEEAMTGILDPLSVTVPDSLHSLWEPRFLTIGMTDAGRLLLIAHAEQGETMRLISARLATRRERLRYEQGN
jgi:uncharacterized DUF497 family protein